uniref:AP-5 complex subunit zeta-1-like n=1 Tax=Saccoglossus kowalevskii TaxID=10224 RepID=A0ABM0MAS1_SACKO|nr:PREDICTED: AP-5 complex subunit zeta-1-like [Saccoglossus kowalevskii]
MAGPSAIENLFDQLRLPKELVTRLKRLLIEPNQGSGRIRIACNTVLCEYCPTESLVIDSMNTLPDDKQIPYILPVVNNQGRNIGQLEKLFIPQLVRWISTVGFDYEIQTRSLSCLANAVMLHQSILDKEQMHIVSSQLADWLRNASVHQAQNPFSRKVFKGEEGSLVTDIDGTASRDIFTILSIGHYYSGDQLLNIHSFSMLKSWLISSHPSAIPLDKASLETSESYSSGFSTRARGVLKEKSCEYCLRIIDQCERKPMKAQDGHLQHACLVEVLSILDILCQQDNTLIARLFPTIKRVYLQIADNMDYPRVHLALIQFFLNHGDTVMYDPQQAYETFFTKLLSLHYLEESAAFDIIMFLQDNLAVLSLQTNIIEKYFPNLLRVSDFIVIVYRGR